MPSHAFESLACLSVSSAPATWWLLYGFSLNGHAPSVSYSIQYPSDSVPPRKGTRAVPPLPPGPIRRMTEYSRSVISPLLLSTGFNSQSQCALYTSRHLVMALEKFPTNLKYRISFFVFPASFPRAQGPKVLHSLIFSSSHIVCYLGGPTVRTPAASSKELSRTLVGVNRVTSGSDVKCCAVKCGGKRRLD